MICKGNIFLLVFSANFLPATILIGDPGWFWIRSTLIVENKNYKTDPGSSKMANVVQKSKLLIVDVSPSMAQVLRIFAGRNGYDCDVFSDTVAACQALNASGTSGEAVYNCVMLGWPEGEIRIISDLLGSLVTTEHADLPLIVLSDGPNEDVQTLSKQRSNTSTLLWKNHLQAADIIDGLASRNGTGIESIRAQAIVSQSADATVHNIQSQIAEFNARAPQHVLLLDNASPDSLALRDMLKGNGYHVTLVNTAAEARAAVDMVAYDLVVTEYYLRAESGEGFCRYLQKKEVAVRPVYAVLASKNLNDVVRKSLALGAITCLDKSESTETLFARLDAIAKGLTQRAAVPAIDIAPIDSNTQLVPPTAFSSKDEVLAEADVLKADTESVVPPMSVATAEIAETPEPPAAPVVLDAKSIERVIGAALADRSERSVCHSVLMLDIKMIAAVTGDRMGIGASAPLREMIKAKLMTLYTRKNSLGYVGDGKFVLFLSTAKAEEAVLLAKKLIEVVPTMIDYLSDVKLVTHASICHLPVQSDIKPSYVLTHCTAACARMDIDKTDNGIYVINPNQTVPSVRVQKPVVRKSKVESKPVAARSNRIAAPA